VFAFCVLAVWRDRVWSGVPILVIAAVAFLHTRPSDFELDDEGNPR
jgi:hypothetical protein